MTMRDGLVPTNPQATPPEVAPEYAADRPSGPVHAFERPLAALRRYKWLVAAISVMGLVVGVVATRFIPPKYEVRATIWIESATPQGDSRMGPIRSGELLNATAWIELFKSYRVVDEVVTKLALYLRPATDADAPMFAHFALDRRFAPGKYELQLDRGRRTWRLQTSSGVEVDRGAAGDSVGRKVGFLWWLPSTAWRGAGESTIRFSVATPRETSVELLEQLSTTLMMNSNFLWLRYQDADAKGAARILNAWVAEYVNVAAELKRSNVREFAKILEEQLRFAEKATQDAERAYESFRVNTITLPTQAGPVAPGIEATLDPALKFFFEQKIQYDNLRNDREAMQRSLAAATGGTTPYEGLLLIPSVAQSPGAEALRNAFKSQYEMEARLRAERQSFTDNYPTVKELNLSLMELRTQTIPRLAAQLLEQLRQREIDYERRIQGASKELEQIPPRTIEEMRLNRAVSVAAGLYTNLKNRYAEAKLAEASATPDISILDTAVAPLAPTKSSAPRILLMTIVGGLAVAIGLALLLDQMDGRFRYADQAASELGLIIAGTVPRIPKNGLDAKTPEHVVQFVESFRTLRMHVMHSLPGQRLTFSITSAGPADGKSLVSSNLALSFAEAGFRTVLVDGDTRRGGLHRMFGLSAADGLTEYLTGVVGESNVVRATPHTNLWFLSCGRRHPRSPELLATPRLQHLVDYLTRSFDVVILDTPPLAAGIDGYAISAAARNCLMVIRMGQTHRRLATTKLSVLDRLPVDVLGAVLNGVQPTGEFQYYAYTKGYAIDDVDSAGELAGIGEDGKR